MPRAAIFQKADPRGKTLILIRLHCHASLHSLTDTGDTSSTRRALIRSSVGRDACGPAARRPPSVEIVDVPRATLIPFSHPDNMPRGHSNSLLTPWLLLVLSMLCGCALDTPLTPSPEQQRAQLTSKQLDVAKHPKCCDDLTKVNPWVMLNRGIPAIVPIGGWPNERVVEIEGFRSFYALIALSEPAAGGEQIWIASPPASRTYVDPVTGSRNGDIFIATVTFLDSARGRIGTVVPTLVAATEGLGFGGNVELPKGAAFLVLHSSPTSLQMPARWVTFGGATMAVPAGKVWIPITSPSISLWLYPALSGLVNVMQPN